MDKKPIAGLLLACSMLLHSSISAALTLDQTVDAVLKQHPDILSAQHTLLANDYRVNQSRSDLLPTLGISAEYSDNDGTQSGIDTRTNGHRSEAFLRWSLFNGLATLNGIKAAKYDRKAAQEQLNVAREQVILTITRNYLDIIRLGSQLRASNDYIHELEKLKRIVDLRSQTGRVAVVESDQAESRLIFARNARETIKREYQTAFARFIELSGLTPENLSPPRFNQKLVTTTIDELFEQVAKGNPQIKAALHNADARLADVSVARGELMPSVNLEYRQKLDSKLASTSSFDSDSEGTVNLNYEIPLGGGSWFRTKEAAERNQVAKYQHKSTLLNTRTSLIQVHEQLKEAHTIAPSLSRNLKSTKRVVDAYAMQFNAGKRTLLDLLSAWSDRYQAQSAVVTNWYDRTSNTATLLALTGELGREVKAKAPLNISLPAKTSAEEEK